MTSKLNLTSPPAVAAAGSAAVNAPRLQGSAITRYVQTDSFTTFFSLFKKLSESHLELGKLKLLDLNKNKKQKILNEKTQPAYDAVLKYINTLPEDDKRVLLDTSIREILKEGLSILMPKLEDVLKDVCSDEELGSITPKDFFIANNFDIIKAANITKYVDDTVMDTESIKAIAEDLDYVSYNSRIIEDAFFSGQDIEKVQNLPFFDVLVEHSATAVKKAKDRAASISQSRKAQIYAICDIYNISSPYSKEGRIQRLISTMTVRQLFEIYEPDAISRAFTQMKKLTSSEYATYSTFITNDHIFFRLIKKKITSLKTQFESLHLNPRAQTLKDNVKKNLDFINTIFSDRAVKMLSCQSKEEVKDKIIKSDLASAQELQTCVKQVPDKINEVIDQINTILKIETNNPKTILVLIELLLRLYEIKKGLNCVESFIQRIFQARVNETIKKADKDSDLDIPELVLLEETAESDRGKINSQLVKIINGGVDVNLPSTSGASAASAAKTEFLEETFVKMSLQDTTTQAPRAAKVEVMDSSRNQEASKNISDSLQLFSNMLEEMTLKDKDSTTLILNLRNLIAVFKEHLNSLPQNKDRDKEIVDKLFNEMQAHILLAFEQLSLVMEMYKKGSYNTDGGFVCINGIIVDVHVSIEAALQLQYYLHTGKDLKTHDLDSLFKETKDNLTFGDRAARFLRNNKSGLLAARYPYRHMETSHSSIKRVFDIKSNDREHIEGAIDLIRIMVEIVFLVPNQPPKYIESMKNFCEKIIGLKEEGRPKANSRETPFQEEDFYKHLSSSSVNLSQVLEPLPKMSKTTKQIQHYIRLLQQTKCFIDRHPQEESTFLRTRYQFLIEKTYEEILVLLCNLKRKKIEHIHDVKELINLLELRTLPPNVENILSAINIGNNTHYLFKRAGKDKQLLQQTHEYTRGVREKLTGIEVVRSKREKLPQLPEQQMQDSLHTFNEQYDVLLEYLPEFLKHVIRESEDYLKKHELQGWLELVQN